MFYDCKIKTSILKRKKMYPEKNKKSIFKLKVQNKIFCKKKNSSEMENQN